jgi:hypothetical protein
MNHDSTQSVPLLHHRILIHKLIHKDLPQRHIQSASLDLANPSTELRSLIQSKSGHLMPVLCSVKMQPM